MGSVTVGGVKYTIDSGYSSDMIPAGFDADVMTYEGEDVLAAVSTKYNVTLFYLINDKGEGSFFMYDSKNKSFFPYKVIESGGHRYILADSSYAEKQPSGCAPGQITVNDVTFDALISSENGDFAYFYAINDKGARGWYCYDKAENTIQRMFVVDMGDKPEETTPSGTTGDEETETDDGLLGSLENDNNNLRKDKSELIKTRNLIIAIASVLLVVMLVIIVVMAAHKSEKKRSIDIDVEALADEEEEIELAEAELAAEEDSDDSDKPSETKDTLPETEDALPESDHEAETAESDSISEEEAGETAAESEVSAGDLEEAGSNAEAEAMSEENKPADMEITDEDIKAFEKEAEALTETLAADVSGVIDEEEREIEPEIIDLAVEDESKTADAGVPDAVRGTDKKDTDDGIEIIDADDEGDDDFFL